MSTIQGTVVRLISSCFLFAVWAGAIFSWRVEAGAASGSWRPLFNGHDLDGWQQVGPGSFQIVGQELETSGGMGLLWYTREKFRDVRIRVVFKLSAKNADSGVFIRIPEKPADVWMPINKGYEIEIGDWPDDYSCTGVVYSFSKALSRPVRPFGEWNNMEITLEGPRIIVYLNGVKVTDYREGQTVPRESLMAVNQPRVPGKTLDISDCRIIQDRPCILKKFQ